MRLNGDDVLVAQPTSPTGCNRAFAVQLRWVHGRQGGAPDADVTCALPTQDGRSTKENVMSRLLMNRSLLAVGAAALASGVTACAAPGYSGNASNRAGFVNSRDVGQMSTQQTRQGETGTLNTMGGPPRRRAPVRNRRPLGLEGRRDGSDERAANSARGDWHASHTLMMARRAASGTSASAVLSRTRLAREPNRNVAGT